MYVNACNAVFILVENYSCETLNITYDINLQHALDAPNWTVFTNLFSN